MDKKILIFHPYLAPYRIDLYNKLSEFYKVKVILTASRKEIATLGFDLDYINEQAKFEYEYTQEGFYFGRHLISLVYAKIISAFRPNFIIAHELGVNTLFSILLKPFVKYQLWVTVDDSPKMINNYGRVRKILQHFVVSFSEVLLVVHPKVQDSLSTKYGSSTKCNFIYFPIIQNDRHLELKLKKSHEESMNLINTYDLAQKTVFLFVGRLEPVKSPELLLQAFSEIDYTNSILVYVGDGSIKDDLKNTTISLKLNNHVLFAGKLSGSKLYAWYNVADVFVLPSMFEPFGAVVNEALVAGCHVVVSDKVGANCLINDSNGAIFKSEDLNELKKGLSVQSEKRYKKTAHINKMSISFDNYVEVFIKNTKN
jgi:glycosyltransferase involved in cell wall biosynthesis